MDIEKIKKTIQELHKLYMKLMAECSFIDARATREEIIFWEEKLNNCDTIVT